MRKRWVGHVPCMGDMRNAYKILVTKSEGKRSVCCSLPVVKCRMYTTYHHISYGLLITALTCKMTAVTYVVMQEENAF
jgi:hypothetical protein